MSTHTKKNRTTKNTITIEKYKKTILGVTNNIYIIYFNTNYNCKKNITIKKTMSKIKKGIIQNIKLLDYLTQKKVKTVKINKNDKKIMEKITKIINPNEKYTYCLNKDTLILAETKTNINKSFIKDITSKHIMLCNETACASGELVIDDNTFIFDNSSGSFIPSIQNIQILKKALPFLKLKIIDMNSKIHDKYFSKY